MLNEFIETQKAELAAYGVEIRYNTPATVEAVKELGADGVFLACGGKTIVPDLPGIEKAVTAEDVLAGRAEVKGEKVAVIGGGVTGVEMLDKVGGNLYPSLTLHLCTEIMKAGGAIAKGKALAAVNDGTVTVCDAKTQETSEIEADTVVLAMGVRPDRTVYAAFKEAFGDDLVLVGDAAKGGQIYDALHAAHDRAFVYRAY